MDPYIAPYRGDAQAAFSYTFDDGFRHQVENALAILEPLDIRGTFFIMPHSMAGDSEDFISWERLREMRDNGHEIATHASIRPKLHEVDQQVAAGIINGGWEAIREHVGVDSVSFAYPGGSQRRDWLEAIIAEHHPFNRGRNLFPEVRIRGYGSTDRRHWTPEKARADVKEAMENGEWLVAIVHAIIKGWSPFESKDQFREHCEWLRSHGEDLWIAPHGEVGRYIGQRNAASLEVLENQPGRVRFRLTCTAEPASVYNRALTVVLPTGKVADARAWAGALAYPPAPLEATQRDGKIRVEVPRNAGLVTVEWTP